MLHTLIAKTPPAARIAGTILSAAYLAVQYVNGGIASAPAILLFFPLSGALCLAFARDERRLSWVSVALIALIVAADIVIR